MTDSIYSACSQSRRGFLKFTTGCGVVAAANRMLSDFLAAAALPQGSAPAAGPFLNFSEVPMVREDRLTVPQGCRSEILLTVGTAINSTDAYGDDNDYLGWFLDFPDTGWLWVNHENSHGGRLEAKLRPDEDALSAVILRNVGGSCLRLHRDPQNGKWRPRLPSAENFRVDGLSSRILLSGPAAGHPLMGGATEVTGSLANCGGAVSPWNTFFSGEENFQDFFGDPDFNVLPGITAPKYLRPPSHYGWMVEIDPVTRLLIKHTLLGRFAHENIAFAQARDGRLVAYMGDDRQDQCLYKYVSAAKYRPQDGKGNRSLLLSGTLHVADTRQGRWIPLTPEHPALKAAAFDLPKICVATRQAAKLAGGTPLARPEDVEVNPATGEIYVCLTSFGLDARGSKSGPAGAILALREKGGDHGALEFECDILVQGSSETGLIWPDNLSFGPGGELIITTDFKSSEKPEAGSAQELVGNNQIFVAATAGAERGTVRRFAVAPFGAEFCSPTLSPCGTELWVSVQHPGEGRSSHWPDGGTAAPRSSLAAISRD